MNDKTSEAHTDVDTCEWFEATTREDQAALNLEDTMTAMRLASNPYKAADMSNNQFSAVRLTGGWCVLKDGQEHIPCASGTEARIVATELNNGEASVPQFDDANACIMASIRAGRG